MKLLLTSSGFTNDSIVQALKDLVGKPFEDLSVAFIPTAANGEEGDKWWVLDDMLKTQKLGWAFFDIVDFSALPRSIWLRRLQSVDVLVFGGGSTYHLMQCIETSGFREAFSQVMKDKVYVGISAGSMITTREVQFGWDERFYGVEAPLKKGEGLGLVDFHIMPHLYPSDFPKVTLGNIAQLTGEVEEPIYAIDNDTAVVVTDNQISVVSEGQWQKFN